jgi:tetratricopeptide (TPR) repeat protein
VIRTPRSAFRIPRSAIRDPPSAIRDPLSAIRYPGKGKIRSMTPRARRSSVLLAIGAVLSSLVMQLEAQSPADPLASLDRTIADAEAALRANELQIAESHYRTAIADGWLMLGALAAAGGQLADARESFTRASTLTVDAGAAFRALAIVSLQLGEIDRAVDILTRISQNDPRDIAIRRLLAQALVAQGKPAEAVQELEEAHAAAPNDVELTFLLASGYLRLKKNDAADRLFAEVVRARPIAETHVLIARTYRDAGNFTRAQKELNAALEMDPRVRRAHYYLGTIDLMSEGIVRLEPAIANFEAEMKVSPADPATSLGLGLALVHARRPAEALPHLQRAVKTEALQGNGFYYLGRCLLALDRPAEAAVALQRSLELARSTSGTVEGKNIHYQLGLALRAAGKTEEAAAHFAEADRAWDTRLAGDRERLARYLADAPEAPSGATVNTAVQGALPFGNVAPEVRTAVAARVRTALARAYSNVGIMHTQGGRFARAAEFFEGAASLDANFPQVQYSLGVAYFNAKQFDKARQPLERALAATPDNVDARRMFALSLLNTDEYARAAELLRNDPRRESDPNLQYAYGLALARSEHGADAAIIFDRLLAEHGERADFHVVLGQAHAQQGDFENAVKSLEHALALDANVAEAHRTLGNIYFRQGRFAEATTQLRAELKSHPGDLKAVHTLAAVLDSDGHPDQAVPLLRTILASQSQHADARYLLGKILLAQGVAAEAVQHLEAAARLSPDDASVHYQLGQAYLKTGRSELAEQQFELFRQIKDKRRGKSQ